MTKKQSELPANKIPANPDLHEKYGSRPKDEVCGAKRHRDKMPCQNRPVKPGGRCRFHGGNAGSPLNNENNKQEGTIYSKYFTPEEEEFIRQCDIGSLDNEINLFRVRLRRALYVEQKQNEARAAGILADEAEYLEEVSLDEKLDRWGEKHELEKRVFRYANIEDIINRTTGRLESLIAQRAALQKVKVEMEIAEIRLAQERIREAKANRRVTAIKRTVVPANNEELDK